MLAVALHRQLLQIGRKPLQVLLVGQHRNGLRAEEVVVPDGQQAHEHRQIPLERRGAEMLVHLVKAVQHRAEIVRADGQHGRKADGRVHGVAAADPIPEAEHVGGVDAELRTPSRHWWKRRRNAWPRPSRSPPRPLERPIARALRIGHRLQRGEGLGRNDEQRFRRVEVAGGLHEVSAVHVGDEAERHVALAVMLECLVGHDRPKVGAADADVDHVADAFAGMAFPLAAADAVGEIGHLVEHGVDLGHDILAVHHDGCRLRRAQGHMQDGAIFCDVDLVPAEHRVDALRAGRIPPPAAKAA